MVHKKNVSYVTVNAKDNASERKESLLFISRAQLILCKSTQYLMQKYTINLLLPLFLIIFEELFTQCCRTVIFM